MGISMQPEQRRYRPVSQQQGFPTAFPAVEPSRVEPTPMVPGAAQPVSPVPTTGGRGPRTATGDLAGGPGMPGGRPGPANAGGFRPFVPANGAGGMGNTGRAMRPTTGGSRPTIGMPPAPPPPPPALPPIEPSRLEPAQPIDQGAPDFDANLRSNVYTPGEDMALASAQKGTQTALNNITGGPSYSSAAASGEGRYRKLFGDGAVEAGEGVDPTGSNRYLSEQDAALKGLAGPSRTDLAKQALKDFEAQGQKALEGRFRKVGQTAAKFGRIGMGDVNAELGSIAGDFERDRLSKMNELARSVSEGDIGDRFRRVDATSGLRRGESGIESGLRSEARTERDYTTGVNERNVDRSFDRARSAIDYSGRDADRDIQDRYDQYGAAGSLEDRLFNQGRTNRDEFRSERARQDDVAQRSLDNRIRERSLGNAEREQRLSRALALMQAGGKMPSLDELLGG